MEHQSKGNAKECGKTYIKAKKKGKATITIKAGSLKKTCKITVK